MSRSGSIHGRKALSLEERIALFRTRGRKPTPVDSGTAAGRAERWMQQFPFDDPEIFKRRLAVFNQLQHEFLNALSDDQATWEDLSDSKALDWTRTLEDIYASSEPTTLSTAHDIDDWAAQTPSFARLVTPIVECYAGRLLASIDALNEGRDTPIIRAASLHTSCVQSLIGGLQRMITPTLILKLNLHRLRDDLNGNTAEKRYQSFIKRLAIPAYALGLFQEYPVLARQIARLCEQWLASTIEFLGHWIEDALSIEATFSPDRALGELVQLQCNLGDRHRDGRAVQIAEFSSGIRVVYKPRSLAVDLHFNALLEWVNERAGKAILRPLAVFDRGSHGWVEYVRAMDCPSLNLVDQYDECQGGLLALFYVLAGTDLHCDNIIACGSCPVVVDVETIFHPRLGAKARGCAAEGLAWSVVGTGLLPFPLRMREDAEPIDRSGLGAGQCEISPFALLCPEQAGTDQLHLVRKHLSIMPSSHRPTLKGTPVGRINGDRVLEGFRAVYTLLLKHRDELLSHGGPIARFLGDEVRIVLRNTVVYSRILSESYHPDVLRDSLDREQMFDRLWGNVPDSPHLAVVAAAETRDLLNGDVPYFTGRVGSRHLYTSDCKLIPDFLEDPSDAFVRKRVDSLGPTNLEQQAWLIEASLMTLPPDRVWIGSSPDPVFKSALSTGSLSSKLIAHASSIADRLETLSFSSGGEADWVSLKLRLKKNWSVTPCGPDLYEGLAGIVLFLAYLGAITKEQRYHDLACAGALRLKAQVESLRGSTHPIGAFVGWGGLIYTFSHLAELWQSAEFFERARTLLHEVERLIEEDHHYDVVAGAAGCLRCLLVMDRLDPSGLPLTLAARCGEYLVRSAKAMERGAGWANNPSSQPLTGFAHGAAGVFWALMALGDATGEARFCETAYRSLAYERDLFDDATGDWADLRANRDDRDHPPARMAAWCHGAAGIGLSRIEHFQKDGDNLTRIEIEAAVQATLSAGFGRNHSLCHGDLGNLDFLQQAAEALDREAWRLQLATRIEGLLDEMERCGPRCGIPKSLPIPGFMTGLAGIGFGLLRLATPQAVPCVLTLAPPPARRSDQSHPSANPDR